MSVLANVIWFLFGGGLLALGWIFVGLIYCVTIIGIPFGIQCFKFASLVLWPFGKTIYYSTSTVSFFANIIWILFFGWELAIAALMIGCVWCLSIIGFPFGVQCFKFAKLALMPFGAKII